VPGYEAPINLIYSQRNRSGRSDPAVFPQREVKRVEVRFPDPAAKATSPSGHADGRAGRHPEQAHAARPADKDLYDLSPEDLARLPSARTLDEALDALEKDTSSLLKATCSLPT